MRAKLLKALGPEQCSELHIIGRSRKQKVMLDAEHVLERMEAAGKTYEYMQVSTLCFVALAVCNETALAGQRLRCWFLSGGPALQQPGWSSSSSCAWFSMYCFCGH